MVKEVKKFDIVDFIMRYEQGEATEQEVIDGFQYLVDTGEAWSLQGMYGRQARDLIHAGLVTDTHNRLGGK